MRLLLLLVTFLSIPFAVSAAGVPVMGTDGRLEIANCPVTSYKKTKSFIEDLLEVPATWSYFYRGEFYADDEEGIYTKPFVSVAQDGVAFGDTNWNQVDFHALSGTAMAKILRDAKAHTQPNETWSKESVSGRRVDVLTHGPDNGEYNKFASGGKAYFIRWKVTQVDYDKVKRTYDMGIFLNKQALGDAAFECGFAHMLKTLDLKQFERFAMNYPVLQKKK